MGDSFRPLVQLYFDQELDTAKSLEVENHLLLCEDCSAEYKRLQDLRSAFQTPGLRFNAPPGLAARVLKPARRRRWLPIGLSLAAACLILISLGALFLGGANRETDEVVAAHIRSMLANHLTDVVSTSSHTVKPWLGDRLDFSPPVVDLASEGSPLIGGRLDYLEGRTVAALVYAHGKHTINVLVAPGSGLPRNDSEKGFNVMEWSSGGMRFWAVSDLNPGELDQFVKAFRAKLG